MTTDSPTVTGDSLEPEVITPTEAIARVEDGALLIDVRPEEYLTSDGSTPLATWVDRTSMADQFLEGGANYLGASLDPEREIVVMCGSVNGSAPMARWLLANGHTNVSHVDGGFAAWREAGLPTS